MKQNKDNPFFYQRNDFRTKACAIVILCLVALFSPFVAIAKGENEIFLKFEPSEKRIYPSQRFVVDLVLYVPTGIEVASIQKMSNPMFDGLKWSENSFNRHDESILDSEKSKDGKYNKTTVGRYVLVSDNPGQFKITPGRYFAFVLTGEKMIDPFWGTAYYKKERVEVQSESTSLKIQDIGKTENVLKSGIGEFEAAWILPPGDIEPGQEGIVILEIKGNGDLQNAEWPDLGNSFGSGLKFIGMSPDVNVFIKDGKIYSVARLECTFSASEPGDYIIESADVPFYSTERHKRVLTKSKPIKVKIEKGKISKRPTQYMDI